jgi:hypothetical protein
MAGQKCQYGGNAIRSSGNNKGRRKTNVGDENKPRAKRAENRTKGVKTV